MVIVLVGVLAVYAAPRLFNATDFYARGFHDETLALLRYAQKTAIAQRRTVCVSFTVSSATLKVDSDGSAGCETDLTGPRGETPGRITARSGVRYSAQPAAVSFDALGRASNGQTLGVQGVGRSITVEAGSGYVHE